MKQVWVVPILLALLFTPGQAWERTYGGSMGDWGNSVQQTTDGGYIIAGETESFGAGEGDVYLIKTNTLGGTLWTKTYGGSKDDGGGCVRQTSEGGYIIAGWTESFGGGGSDVYLIMTNTLGDTLWTKTYGGSSDDWGASFQQTSDGGYIIAGGTESFGASSYPDVYLIKTDSLGNSGGHGIQEQNGKPIWELRLTVPSLCHGNINLSFFLPACRWATIELFDIAGEKVGTLTDGERPAGWHRLTSKLSVPAGVYFVKLSTTPDNSAITRKIILLK